MTKQFVIVKPGTNENVLGGSIGEDNAYIAAYPRPEPGNKHPHSLEVGESSLCAYSLSGSRGVYRVVRIDDIADGRR
jgi:hypothetical protein